MPRAVLARADERRILVATGFQRVAHKLPGGEPLLATFEREHEDAGLAGVSLAACPAMTTFSSLAATDAGSSSPVGRRQLGAPAG